MSAPAILIPAIESGKARLLMVTNRQRSPIAPEVPTAEEAGFPELTFDGVVGFFGGRDLPVPFATVSPPMLPPSPIIRRLVRGCEFGHRRAHRDAGAIRSRH